MRPSSLHLTWIFPLRDRILFSVLCSRTLNPEGIVPSSPRLRVRELPWVTGRLWPNLEEVAPYVLPSPAVKDPC